MKPDAELLHVDVYDTTLRDGTQREGLTLSCEDKLRIAQRLDAFGVSFIEAGWPGSNPKDEEFFRRAREVAWTTSQIVAFGSTRRAGVPVEEDAGLRSLLDAQTGVCTIFGKAWTLHVTEVLRTSREENLAMIEESVAFLRKAGRRVFFDAEHFFDGFADDATYALEAVRAAARGGAEAVVLCDTNGGSLPWRIEDFVRAVRNAVDVPLGIHVHDDSGCAVANSLAAVRAGARHVQGTFNGYGERCGNANLCTIVADLELKLGARCLPSGALRELSEVSHFVAEVANLAPDDHAPYVGRSAFAHKAGVHVAAMRRSVVSYNHVDPARVGNETRVVVSDLAGRATLRAKAEEHAVALHEDSEKALLADIKEQEAKGFAFDAADASVALMIRRRAAGYVAPFRLLDYKVIVGHRHNGDTYSEATIKIAIGDATLHTAAEGEGPVVALDAALRKALAHHYPSVMKVRLEDYKVRILDGRDGTAATTRVAIDSTDGERRWSTVGASPSIIEASWIALADAIEYALGPSVLVRAVQTREVAS